MHKWLQFDERTDKITGKLSFIFLFLVQIILLLMIFYQRYLQNRPPPYYNDLAILLGISTAGYWLVNLFMGGIMPTLAFWRGVILYLLLVASIAVPYTLIRGLPAEGLWTTWILVILGGPGALVGGYSLAAYLGAKRLDRITSPEEEG